MIDVLVVDDNQDMAECLESLFTLEGHRVRLAADGEAGLAALSDRLPDAVILDVEMPGLDGPGMAHQMIVDDCGRESIPIVLTSAMVRLREIAARMGTPYYLAKPYDASTLLSLVTRAAKERIAPCPPTPAGVSPCKLE
jgi:CheY-like chemotaxis protein